MSFAENRLHSLRLLSITLLDVEVILPQCELSDDRAKHYLEAQKDSVKALEEMEGKLAKFLGMPPPELLEESPVYLLTS